MSTANRLLWGTDQLTWDGSQLIWGFQPDLGLSFEIAFGYKWGDTSPVWTDITAYVYSEWTIERGRSAELDSFQAGRCSFDLVNDDRRFDPLYSAGPYFGNLVPNVPVRIRASFDGTTYDLFRGFVDGWPQTYTTADQISTVQVNASDAFKLLSQMELVAGFFTFDSSTLGVLDQNRLGGEGVDTVELSGDRVDTLLDLAAWPETFRDVSEGATLCQAQTTDGSALEALQIVEQSEDGFFYVEADGDLTFVGRHERQTNSRMSTSQVTFSDEDDDYPYEDLRYRYDDQLIFNDVRRTREDGAEQSAEDNDSIASYFRKVSSLTGLVMDSDAVAKDLARVFLRRYKDPILRIESLVVDPGNNPENLYPEVLGRRILDRVTVKRTPQQVGSAIEQELLIQGIRHEYRTGAWRTTFYVTPADDFAFFTFNSETLGVLDEDLLGA